MPDARSPISMDPLVGPSQERRQRFLSFFRAECCGYLCVYFINLAKPWLLLGHAVTLGMLMGRWQGGVTKNVSYNFIFVPSFLCIGIAGILLVCSWIAAIPYIRYCLHHRVTRFEELEDFPSILTDVLPEVFFAGLGIFFLLMLFITEGLLMEYLSSGEREEHQVAVASCTYSICFIVLLYCLIFKSRAAGVYAFVSIDAVVTCSLWLKGGRYASPSSLLLPSVMTSFLLCGCSHFDASLTHHCLTSIEQKARTFELSLLISSTSTIAVSFVAAIRNEKSPKLYMWLIFTALSLVIFSFMRFYCFILEVKYGCIERRLKQSPPPPRVVALSSRPPYPSVGNGARQPLFRFNWRRKKGGGRNEDGEGHPSSSSTSRAAAAPSTGVSTLRNQNSLSSIHPTIAFTPSVHENIDGANHKTDRRWTPQQFGEQGASPSSRDCPTRETDKQRREGIAWRLRKDIDGGDGIADTISHNLRQHHRYGQAVNRHPGR